ncbi:hypothetical protein [Burkholderia cepacia]|uniref:hypothetical protein n=1 Tax=Burkholderia cepacia TaxID=292 RepID=UPI00158E00B1|nr:hypothetical protein [Burkholderia cepacia]
MTLGVTRRIGIPALDTNVAEARTLPKRNVKIESGLPADFPASYASRKKLQGDATTVMVTSGTPEYEVLPIAKAQAQPQAGDASQSGPLAHLARKKYMPHSNRPVSESSSAGMPLNLLKEVGWSKERPLDHGLERVTFASCDGASFTVAGKRWPDDPSRLTVTRADTGETLLPPLHLKRTPTETGFVWMPVSEAGLKGGVDINFNNLPNETFGVLDNVRVEQAGWSLAGLDFFDNNTNESLGNCWIRGDISEDKGRVEILGVMNDSSIRGCGLDLVMFKVCKENQNATIIFDASFDQYTLDKMKKTYGMKGVSDISTTVTENAQAIMGIAQRRLEANGWHLKR